MRTSSNQAYINNFKYSWIFNKIWKKKKDVFCWGFIKGVMFFQMKISAIDESRHSILAKKGPIQVFQAKYSYDPFQHSPNENPDAELPINAGDYVLVYGEMDEVSRLMGDIVELYKCLHQVIFILNMVDKICEDIYCRFAKKYLQSIHRYICRHKLDSSIPVCWLNIFYFVIYVLCVLYVYFHQFLLPFCIGWFLWRGTPWWQEGSCAFKLHWKSCR